MFALFLLFPFYPAAVKRYTTGISSSGDKHSLFILSVSTSTLSNFTPLFFTFLTALFPSFCYASFSFWFTAGPQGRGACLLTLSPEGAGKKLAITMSKYVHAKSPLLMGIVCWCMRGEMGSWRPCRDHMGPPPFFYNCYISFTCAYSQW